MGMNIENKIREMNREILRLKTSHPIKSNMKTFYGKYNLAKDLDYKTHKYEITYVEGEQPILTTIVGVDMTGSSRLNVLMVPNNNKQIMLDMNAHHSGSTAIILLSTRQILGFRKIS